MIIRNVVADDAKDLLNKYKYYVTNTAITFEIDIPSLEEFQKRIENIIKKFPYICIELDNKIIGYAYSHEFNNGREAYRYSNEVTIYLDKDYKHKGYGKLLYNELESRLKKLGIINLYACISSTIKSDEYLDNNSELFHNHLGYKKVGEFKKCGYKFNRWYDMIWMEKIIGCHK